MFLLAENIVLINNLFTAEELLSAATITEVLHQQNIWAHSTFKQKQREIFFYYYLIYQVSGHFHFRWILVSSSS